MINITVNEQGTLKIVITFTDEDDVEHDISTLKSVNWQLSDNDGNVIGTMSFDNGLITANPVMLTCEQLAIGDDGIYRIFAVEIVYDSSNGSDLCAKEELRFKIQDLVNFS